MLDCAVHSTQLSLNLPESTAPRLNAAYCHYTSIVGVSAHMATATCDSRESDQFSAIRAVCEWRCMLDIRLPWPHLQRNTYLGYAQYDAKLCIPSCMLTLHTHGLQVLIHMLSIRLHGICKHCHTP